MSSQQQDQHWIAGATEIQQLNPDGPDQKQRQHQVPPNLIQSFYAGSVISEARSTGVELKCAAKLLTVLVFATKRAVCRITFVLYPVLFWRKIVFPNW